MSETELYLEMLYDEKQINEEEYKMYKYRLKGLTQREIAENMKYSQSYVNQKLLYVRNKIQCCEWLSKSYNINSLMQWLEGDRKL